MPATYSEFTTYSPLTDSDVVRLSMVDDQGAEFYCLLPQRVEGKAWRKLKAEALDVLSEAIESGMGAGEIRWRVT